ncbi:MAG: DUF6898 family protein [Caulobacterales bacterium]
MPGREVLFESQLVGGTKRIAAIDAATGIEVVILAPAHATDAEVESVALAKLSRALAREGISAGGPESAQAMASQDGSPAASGEGPHSRPTKPGIWA